MPGDGAGPRAKLFSSAQPFQGYSELELLFHIFVTLEGFISRLTPSITPPMPIFIPKPVRQAERWISSLFNQHHFLGLQIISGLNSVDVRASLQPFQGYSKLKLLFHIFVTLEGFYSRLTPSITPPMPFFIPKLARQAERWIPSLFNQHHFLGLQIISDLNSVDVHA
jgi:hypothetical protein